MNFFSNFFSTESTPQQMEKESTDKKMAYALSQIQKECQPQMDRIKEDFQTRIDSEKQICYESYGSDIDQFAECVNNKIVKLEGRLAFYSKKVAFVSLTTSVCFQSEGTSVDQCVESAKSLTRDIIGEELQQIRVMSL